MPLLIACAIFLIISALCLMYVEIKASRKRAEINAGIRAITRDTGTKEVMAEGAVLGFGAEGLTMLDFYANAENHEKFLKTIEYRYPNEMGNANLFDWDAKVQQLYENGSQSAQNYVNAYAGQMGEFAAQDFFHHHGMSVEPFESRTYEHNDLLVHNHDGSAMVWSVKSGTQDYVVGEIHKHADHAHNYIINHETFIDMKSQGLIEAYRHQGYTIIDGGWLHQPNVVEAKQALADMHEAGDAGHHLPYIALGLFGWRTVKNTKELFKGNQSIREYGANVTGDGVRIGTGFVGAKALGALGAKIGTGFSPGVGTIIGGGVGIIIGAMLGSGVANWLKEKWKWGDIIEAIEAFGNVFNNGLYETSKNNIKIKIFNQKKFEEQLLVEKPLLDSRRKQLNAYSSDRPTLAAVMSYSHYSVLEERLHLIDVATKNTDREILHMVDQLGEEGDTGWFTDKDKIRKRYLGELILGNRDILLEGIELNTTLKVYMHKYDVQKNKNPHHPYRYSMDPKDVLHGIAYRKLLEARPTRNLYLRPNYLMWIITGGLLYAAVRLLLA